MGYRAKFGANFEKMGVFQFRYKFCPNENQLTFITRLELSYRFFITQRLYFPGSYLTLQDSLFVECVRKVSTALQACWIGLPRQYFFDRVIIPV